MRPNVVCILTDGQGAWAMGRAGNPSRADSVRPRMDRARRV
jgi:hypothetical protein